MADPLQQPAAGSLFANVLDLEPVGLQCPSYPFAIGRGLHDEVRGEKNRGYRVAWVVASRGPAPRSFLVQHHLWRNAESFVSLLRKRSSHAVLQRSGDTKW